MRGRLASLIGWLVLCCWFALVGDAGAEGIDGTGTCGLVLAVGITDAECVEFC